MKLALFLLPLAIALMLSGCGAFQRTITHFTGNLTEKCASTGVVYVQSDSGLALLVSRSGAPVTCEP